MGDKLSKETDEVTDRPSAVEDFWYPAELESLGLPPTGSQAGDLIFLSAQTGMDLTSGRLRTNIWELEDRVPNGIVTGLEHRDGREGPVQAQAFQAYWNIAAILETRGTGLGSIVRQRIYLANHRDGPAVEKVIVAMFGDDLPATNFSDVGGAGPIGDELIWIDVVATVDDPASLKKVHLQRYRGATGSYPAAVVTGGLAFTSGVRGVSPNTGRLAEGPEDVPDDVANVLFGGPPWTSMSEVRLKAQMGCAFDAMKELLGSLDVDSSRLIRTNYMTRAGMNEWGSAVIIPRRFLYEDRPRPTTTALAVPSLDSMESEVSVDGVIALGTTEVNRYAGAEIAMSNLDMAVSGGPYVFTTGYVGMDKRLHRAIAGPEDLEEGPGRLLHADGASARGAIRAQAWHTYMWIRRMLMEIGSSGDRVVQQTIYVRDRHDVPEILSFCRQAFMGRLPPTTVVGVEDIGPYPGLLFEVDVIAVRS